MRQTGGQLVGGSTQEFSSTIEMSAEMITWPRHAQGSNHRTGGVADHGRHAIEAITQAWIFDDKAVATDLCQVFDRDRAGKSWQAGAEERSRGGGTEHQA